MPSGSIEKQNAREEGTTHLRYVFCSLYVYNGNENTRAALKSGSNQVIKLLLNGPPPVNWTYKVNRNLSVTTTIGQWVRKDSTWIRRQILEGKMLRGNGTGVVFNWYLKISSTNTSPKNHF